jgi:hypothetical protein
MSDDLFRSVTFCAFAALTLVACGGSSAPGQNGGDDNGETDESSESTEPSFPSAAWTAREAENYARVLEAPVEQVANPVFVERLLARSGANAASYLERLAADPSWALASLGGGQISDLLDLAWLQDLLGRIRDDPQAALSLSFGSPATPLCATYAGPCTGDPFDWADVDPFYSDIGTVQDLVFYDRDCTRLNARVWKPQGATEPLPAVVIQTGSIQAPQTVHWWAAQSLVEAGYVALTFDVRGQGRSDFTAPGGQPGTDLDPTVFYREMVDAIDFLQSSPEQPYPHDAVCGDVYPTNTAPHNPFAAVTDGQRIGLAGHSTGGYSVAVVQALGEGGTAPWPGQLSDTNPVKAVVAWDGMVDPQGEFGAYGQLEHLEVPLYRELFELISGTLAGGEPEVVPRVPAMMHFSDYGAAPIPYVQPPPDQAYKRGFEHWRDAGVPSFAFTILGSSHYEWSLLPLFPATSWCPEVVDGECQGGWGLPMADYYTVAWFDRWLKQPGEAGYDDADARLLDDARFRDRLSYHFASARSFPGRDGRQRFCADMLGGCAD